MNPVYSNRMYPVVGRDGLLKTQGTPGFKSYVYEKRPLAVQSAPKPSIRKLPDEKTATVMTALERLSIK